MADELCAGFIDWQKAFDRVSWTKNNADHDGMNRRVKY